jgi:O-antigen ligase
LSVAANRADQIASSGFAVLAGSGTGLAALGAFVYVHLFAIHRSIAAWFGRDIDYWPASVSAGSIVLAILVWPAAMALWRHGRRRWAGLLIALVAVVLLAGIAVTAKLALILGAFAALVVYFGGRWAVLLLAVPMLAATLLAPLWPLALRPDWHEAWLAPLSGSGLHRLYIWQFVAERIAEKPLLGWGMDAARSLPGQERTIPDGFGRVLQLHPHNFALQVWVELGLVGALAFAASIGLIVRAIAGMTADPIARAGAAATLVAAFVVASSSFGIWQNWWLAGLGLIAAFCVAACRAPHAAIGSAGRLR